MDVIRYPPKKNNIRINIYYATVISHIICLESKYINLSPPGKDDVGMLELYVLFFSF